MSHLFAYLSRMKFIKRWALMRNTYPESIQEHSQRVAVIAHALATIRNRLHGGHVDAARTALLALYHDASEVLTGDLPTPIKYFNPDMRTAYGRIEQAAADRLLAMVPAALQADYRPLFQEVAADHEHWELVHAADKLCAYLKCMEEVAAGNREFSRAEQSLRTTVEAIALPEVRYFLTEFAPSLKLSLDELA
jgi:5'-deoxynucleotidase